MFESGFCSFPSSAPAPSSGPLNQLPSSTGVVCHDNTVFLPSTPPPLECVLLCFNLFYTFGLLSRLLSSGSKAIIVAKKPRRKGVFSRSPRPTTGTIYGQFRAGAQFRYSYDMERTSSRNYYCGWFKNALGRGNCLVMFLLVVQSGSALTLSVILLGATEMKEGEGRLGYFGIH